MSAIENAVPVEELVDGAVQQVNGESESPAQQVESANHADQGEQPEQQATITPVLVRLPSPVHARTLPKRANPSETYTSLTLIPQAHETIQELKLAINEWVGGYWLGPYSLYLPATKAEGDVSGTTRGQVLLHKVKEGVEVRVGERLSDWLEVGDVFSHLNPGDERVLEVVREPYSDFSARQTVLRFMELITPAGSNLHSTATPLAPLSGSTIFEAVRDGTCATASEPVYTEVEVSLPSGRKGKGGKKEVVKVKREVASDSTNPFADWKPDSHSTELSSLPICSPPPTVQPCVKAIQLSPFNPPPPTLRQLGHQLYLQVSLLEGDTVTLVCTSRGWYVSKSNINTFDPTPKSPSDIYHSLIDLLHSLSPLFSERLSLLTPLTTSPASEPIASVPIPQAEPAYPFLAPTPRPLSTSEILRTQLAYLHTGAITADALDSARDWNEEIQGVKELAREGMQERVLREKLGQKTWAEFTQACVRAVLTVSRGDIPPLNPNEAPNCHMWLLSNIFITRATDCVDIYAHMGGDAAAWVSHGKDAAGVRLLNKVDVDGAHLLGHTVVDWAGDRWVCQSMLPGIFARPKPEIEETIAAEADAKATPEVDGDKDKEDWVKVNGSPKSVKSKTEAEAEDATKAEEEDDEELPENPLIVYGVDSEQTSVIHWDKSTHHVMSKVAQALKLAPHNVKDGSDKDHEFFASAEVKALRGMDGRRYMLDLPRLMPVDVEWLEKDISGPIVGPVKGEKPGESYPHRIVLLRPELVEGFWESELKRWARGLAAQKQEEQDAAAKKASDAETNGDANGEVSSLDKAETAETEVNKPELEQSPAAEAAAAQKAEQEKPVDTTSITESIKQFDLRFNPDAFVDQAPKKGQDEKSAFIPSTTTDESDPTIKAVRDASIYLRSIAIPAFTLDVMMGTTSGIMDGQSLSKAMHQRGINVRYLGHLAASIESFGTGQDGKARKERGYLGSFHSIVLQEMVFRASKHILRELVRGLQPEHAPCAVSHFLNCLLSTRSAEIKAVYQPIGLSPEPEPAYVSLTSESLRQRISEQVQKRYRWKLDEAFLTTGMRRKQLLRELATRFAFQLVQRDYQLDAECPVEEDAAAPPKENGVHSEEEKSPIGTAKKDKRKEKIKAPVPTPSRSTVFVPEDILTMVPVVRSTAPPASVPEEIMDAGRNLINRGNMEMGLELMLEAVQFYEQIHSVIHPEVAGAYNSYASTLYQLARVKIQQLSSESADAAQPLGLDIATGIRLQRQAVIIAERTVGVYHPETAAYYFNLAMLENLEGNTMQSLRYFRHVLLLWDVIYGAGHPEINTILSNAGVVLQATNEPALSLALHAEVQRTAETIFGADHLSNGQALHQLTQAHFLAGDIPKALETSVAAFDIFKARLGEENAQTKEVAKNVELLRAVVENVERQKAATQQAKERQMERLRAAQARVAATTRRRITPAGAGALGSTILPGVSGVNGSGSSAAGAQAAEAEQAAAEASRIGERGHLDVDELVKFIQGGGSSGGVKRGKNALRGKRRTGAKR